MKSSIEKLYTISKKQSRKIVGLMSGTSLDGLDIALCEVKGNGNDVQLTTEKFITLPYTDQFRAEIKQVLGKRPVDAQQLCLLNKWVAMIHAHMVKDCLAQWNISNTEIDLIASHGQTIYHAPLSLHQLDEFGNATLQIGDGDHLAVNTGIITISDFRQKHIAGGGEGAPLAAYGDYLLFADKEKNVVLLNIGGIANFTFIPAGSSFKDIVCSDTGPGNTLMDAWMQKKFPGCYFDKDAVIAKQGNVNEKLLTALHANEFLEKPAPKTTGQELFQLHYIEQAQYRSNTELTSYEDVMATLNRFSVVSICNAIEAVIAGLLSCEILVSGGGIHNPLLVAGIKDYFNTIPVMTTAGRNVDPGAKEAVLFALLANEMVAGNEDTFGKGRESYPAISMGKISFPD